MANKPEITESESGRPQILNPTGENMIPTVPYFAYCEADNITMVITVESQDESQAFVHISDRMLFSKQKINLSKVDIVERFPGPDFTDDILPEEGMGEFEEGQKIRRCSNRDCWEWHDANETPEKIPFCSECWGQKDK